MKRKPAPKGHRHPSPKEAPLAGPARGQSVTPIPIAGIGASAGGLEAITSLLSHLPSDTGMAFVVVQHLDPTHPSLLSGALEKVTRMPVEEARNGIALERNHVYVIPPTADLGLLHGKIALVSRADRGTPHMPIDYFFRALAADRGSGAIGIVLSGTASDGTEGLRALKAEGGITFAQDPRSAKFSGMPKSAIAAGVVDYCLPAERIAEQLVRLSVHPYVVSHSAEPSEQWQEDDGLKRLFTLMRDSTAVDFSDYKSPTILRRLARRMVLRKVGSLDDYLALLARDAAETKALCEDVLIRVTDFFRDPQAFQSLKKHAFPEILKHKKEGPFRIWVPGCATGEEPYSIGMCLIEYLDDSGSNVPIQIFASDLSEDAIGRARAGIYSESAVHNVGLDRLRRFFSPVEGGGYRINKLIRDLCVFVRHDLTRDPPFSKLDLISCRNVLIYFAPPLQKRVFPLFHHSLNLPGFLLLGHAEAILGFKQLFSPVDKAQKIFSRSALKSHWAFDLVSGNQGIGRREIAIPALESQPSSPDIQRQADYVLLARYAPAGALINGRMEILQFRGRTGPYLESPSGQPQLNILNMAREGLLPHLRSVLARAKKEMSTVRKEKVPLKDNGQTRSIHIEVIPVAGISESNEPCFWVLFEEAVVRPSLELRKTKKHSEAQRPDGAQPGKGRSVRELTKELAATKEHLRGLTEEQQKTTDELTTANEELLSTNEELQSTNEELETAKEELQSANEELTTLNDELQNRNQELHQINNDLFNLIASVNIPILIIGGDRRIRRFTPLARSLMNLIAGDIGRPVDDIKPNLNIPHLDQSISEVLVTVTMKEEEVQDRSGHWYRIQIRPYMTTDNKVDGCVLSLVDIDVLKRTAQMAESARDEAARARAEAENANRSKDIFLATLSHELRTPLSAMLLQAQLLHQRKLEDAKISRACEVIERAVKLQTRLIDDLLDVSRIIAGKLPMASEEVELTTVIQAAMEEVHGEAAAKSIRIETIVDEFAGPVSGDPIRLKQIFWNLLSNAIKFSPDGARVLVRLERIDNQARIRVRDEGMGIRAEFLPRLFNLFSQQDSSTTRRFRGLGLGLSIVRRLAELHGGTVHAESAGEGKGATFSVTLPLSIAPADHLPALISEAKSPAPRGDGNGRAPQLNGIRVMLVEDDPDGRESLAEALEQYGAEIKSAASADEAMRSIEKFRPEVLLCDISMPGEDGYSLLRKVRELGSERGGQVPAAALTAHAAEEDRARSLSAGFQMHLAKPVDAEKLAAAVEKLAGQRAAPVPCPKGR
jgi:two-component system, chemotaxis family, CheB/CheR fusion protein